MSTNKSIARSAGVISAGIFSSRILGFIRDILFAAFFGTGIYAQAFVVAFRIPNLLRDLIGEGATNSAVVPVLVEELTHQGKKEFWKLSNILLHLVFVISAGITVLGIIFSKPIVVAMAPGFIKDPAQFDVTVSLTQVMFPYLIFIGLSAYGMGVLNSLKHFAAPAFGMCLLNIAMISGLLIWKQDVMGLAIGVLLGGVLQIAIQVPPLLKHGFILEKARFYHPKVQKIAKLMLPRVFGSGVYQINIFVSTILASLEGIVGTGAIAALYFSNRILQFPLALFAISLSQAALPTLSGHIAVKDMSRFKDTLNFLLRGVAFVLLPASAGLIALSIPITKTLLERGAFGGYSTQITASALLFYTFGLLSYGVIKVLVGAFYSMQDTWTPVKVAACSLVINLLLNLLLMFPLKVGGLALATSISGISNCVVLYWILRKRIGPLGETRLLGSLSKILLASVLMGIFAFSLNRYIDTLFCVKNTAALAVNLFITIAAAMVFYIFLCYLLRVAEMKELKEWILKRK